MAKAGIAPPGALLQQAVALAIGESLKAAFQLLGDTGVAETGATAHLLPLAKALETANRPDLARRCYEAAHLKDGALPEAWIGLSRTSLALGMPEEAEAEVRRATALAAEDPEAHLALALVLQQAGRIGQAVSAYRHALARRPEDAGAWNNLGLALHRAGSAAEAEHAFAEAQRQAPALASPALNLCRLCLARGDPAAALEALQTCIATGNRDGTLHAFKAAALRDLGRAPEADALLDVRRFVATARIGTPRGFASLGAFNSRLAEAVNATPSRFGEPGTADGRQTRELFDRPTGVLATLHSLFDRAVADYAARLPADAMHPFCAARPSSWRLHGWSTIMRRVGPQEITHLHPSAWLSGVYYPHVPADLDGEERAGWLEFGRPPPYLPQRSAAPLHMLRPRQGLLVLFPGYFFHRIRPFQAAEARISIAFDAIPAD